MRPEGTYVPVLLASPREWLPGREGYIARFNEGVELVLCVGVGASDENLFFGIPDFAQEPFFVPGTCFQLSYPLRDGPHRGIDVVLVGANFLNFLPYATVETSKFLVYFLVQGGYLTPSFGFCSSMKGLDCFIGAYSLEVLNGPIPRRGLLFSSLEGSYAKKSLRLKQSWKKQPSLPSGMV